MWKTCLGINGFGAAQATYGMAFSMDEFLSHCVETGYDGVELCPNVGPYPTGAAGWRELHALFAGRGLQIAGLQMHVPGSPVSPDRGERRRYVKGVKYLIDASADMGCHYGGVWSGSPEASEGASSDEAVTRMAEVYRDLAAHAAQRQMVLALEPEPVHIVNSVEMLVALLDAVAADNFRAILDFSHAAVLNDGDVIGFLNAIRGRVGHVHLCDTDGTCLDLGDGVPRTSTHLAAGEGILDIEAILRALAEYSYEGWIQVDVWEHQEPYEASRRTKRAVDDILQRLR